MELIDGKYRCGYCKYGQSIDFTSMSDVNKHIVETHKVQINSDNKNSPYKKLININDDFSDKSDEELEKWKT